MRVLQQLFILFFFALLTHNSFAQQDKDIWTTLSDIDWYQKYSRVYNTQIGFPKFSDKTKNLEGKTISLKGYVLPMDTEDGSIIISALPYSSCFFCGGAGIETVMAVFPGEQRKYEMDEQVTFKGTLQLNDGETGLIYNLKEAEEIVPE
ncbi:hypothetical protein [Chondrinema litorale]|uniref:hypothetical protein n=1 Tax=Chondrinema litorale TaxID=2994555 RepID=UPI00254318C8|nr:hypothetical protein [Chondrinema litorale]UZR94418.1 hypothetical protein OQ292_01125 [Chondrinema litorale]